MSKGDSLIIKEVVDNCKERFGGNLVSVVLFGSRDKISLEFGRYVGRRYYKSVQIHLTSEKELEESLNPLFYGVGAEQSGQEQPVPELPTIPTVLNWIARAIWLRGAAKAQVRCRIQDAGKLENFFLLLKPENKSQFFIEVLF